MKRLMPTNKKVYTLEIQTDRLLKGLVTITETLKTMLQKQRENILIFQQ